ncbi:Glycoside hydrolase [Parasponia andersonii]|uniref:glucan endo-1,3-beta-D-glucosidase n=1 Tax=Parasponia andersonii TaxID=3476 RepID=A0A2P5CVA6_PARAD|nr:Glycoside hydrolase [Parasponia andersonii]
MLGNNLPSASEVVALYRSNNINRMRIYDPNQAALQSLRGSNIELIFGVPNSGLQDLANKPSKTVSWLQRNVLNFWPSVRFSYIAVGNEASPINGGTSQFANLVLPAIRNIQNAIRSAGLQDQIKENHFLHRKAPSGEIYADYPRDINLSYALFTSPSVVVRDGARKYQNLYDALLDIVYSTLEKAGGASLEVVVSEGGHQQGSLPQQLIMQGLITQICLGMSKESNFPLTFSGERIQDVSAEYNNDTLSLGSDV